MKARQLTLFPEKNDAGQVPVPYSFQLENGQFEARINGGFWMSRGKTRKQAIRKVIEKYHKEMSRQ